MNRNCLKSSAIFLEHGLRAVERASGHGVSRSETSEPAHLAQQASQGPASVPERHVPKKLHTLILDNFDSFTYNLYQYIAELGGNPEVFRNNEISIEQISKNGYTHIVISPGPGSPNVPKDFGICADVIKKLAGSVPILGVCLGHQGIIHYLGGRVIRAPYPVHGKQSLIRIDNDSVLFKGLPKQINAMRYHSLIGEKKTLPAELKITAETEDGLIMAVEHKTLPLYGIQFHPESIGTPDGKIILKNFLSSKRENKATAFSGENLSHGLTKDTAMFFEEALTGKISEDEIAKQLKTMADRGETVEEITAVAKVMRKHAVKFPSKIAEFFEKTSLMDTCGTGGSGLPRMNISTTAAFVLAACGVKIAKHGNRSAAGRCGSFDLLEKLGININLTPEQSAQALQKTGLTFLFAPIFHPAFKIFGPIRKKLGIRTIFNLLGPLLNPANPKHHLLGTNNLQTAQKLIQVMKNLNYKHAMVVVGEDGLDEVTLNGITHCFELKKGKIHEFTFSPKELGLKSVQNFKEISGGSVEQNAKIFLQLLQGKAPTNLQNLLELNCAFALLVSDKVASLKEGLQVARQAIESGEAFKKFQEYKIFTSKNVTAGKLEIPAEDNR